MADPFAGIRGTLQVQSAAKPDSECSSVDVPLQPNASAERQVLVLQSALAQRMREVQQANADAQAARTTLEQERAVFSSRLDERTLTSRPPLLCELVRRTPCTLAELKACWGFGPAKVAA